MDIKRAKKEIKDSIEAYLAKDEFGDYMIPQIRQRPILLMGPPGIGKTQVMEQVAKECKVALVAYTITHHTRQSAVGLPFIEKKVYSGKEYSVTEYTMSEIIASIYDKMEETGLKEGILFIDEINCVSETLAPTMLQFLQCKMFGNQKIPEGWIIVAAGNPPEYNKSVRDFDVVTLDRIKKIDVDVNYDVWKEYAYQADIHPAILAYLEIRRDYFYRMETTVDGRVFATARGWEDLSRLIQSYEKLGIEINAELVGEFLQKEETARDFAGFYQLYTKYGEDYQIPAILNGELSSEKLKQKQQMAAGGTFEERFAVVNLIQGTLRETAERYENVTHQIEVLHELLLHLRNHVKKISQDEKERDQLPSGISALEEFAQEQDNSLQVKIKMELLSLREQKFQETAIRRLREYILAAKKEHLRSAENGFKRICKYFEEEAARRENLVQKMHRELQSAFSFIKESFGDSQEMLLLVTGITADNTMTTFIAENGCPAYFQYSEMLLYNKEEKNLQKACAEAIQAI